MQGSPGAQAFDPDGAAHGDDEGPEDRREAKQQAKGDAGQSHVGQGVGDQREAARNEEDPDGRANEGGDDANREGPLHEAVLEELREHARTDPGEAPREPTSRRGC